MPDQAQDPTAQIPGRERPPARIVLFRHGAAEGSEEGRFISRTDAALLPQGERQVQESATRVVSWLDGFSDVSIFSSPLLRARQSADILCGALGSGAPRILDDLIELGLGRWEGETYEGLMEKEPERMRAHYADFVRSRAPGGESVADLADRVRPVLRQLIGEAHGSAAIVVAHAAVNRVILLDALGAPLENFFRIDVGLGAFSVIDYHGETPLVRTING